MKRISYLKLYVLISAVLAIIGINFFVATSRATRKNDAVLIVGTAGGYAPFVSLNEQGEYEGFDIDVAQALARQLGKKLELKDLGSMTPLFLALDQGKIDVILWGLSIISERLKKVAMVPYGGQEITSYPLVFWKEIPQEIVSIAAMKGKLVCVEVGSAQENVLSRYPMVRQKQVEKVTDALMEIQYKKADAAFIEPAVAKKFQAQLPEIKLLDVPLADEDKEFGVGIAIKKDRKDLVNQLSQAIAKLKSTGVIANLEKKWGV